MICRFSFLLVRATTITVDGSHQLLELIGVHDQVPEVVVLLNIVDRPLQVLQLLSMNHELLEMVISLDVVYWTLEILKDV